MDAINDKMVNISSQDFHSTAYGEETSLTEHNREVFDPQAVEDRQRLFY